MSGATNATVRNVSTTGGIANGIFVEGGSRNTVGRVTSRVGAVGILLRTTDGNAVIDSTTRDNQNHGLSIQGGDGNLVSGVTSVENFHGDRSATGIDVRGYTPFSTGILVPATHTTVEASTTSDNEDSGIEIYPDSSDTTARRNLTYANGDHGIDVAGAPNTAVVANTIVGNTNVGLNVEAAVTGGVGSTGTTVRDNISAENGIKPSGGWQRGRDSGRRHARQKARHSTATSHVALQPGHSSSRVGDHVHSQPDRGPACWLRVRSRTAWSPTRSSPHSALVTCT